MTTGGLCVLCVLFACCVTAGGIVSVCNCLRIV
jgi:hypothetical protein